MKSPSELPVAMRPSLPSLTARQSMPPPPRQRPAPLKSVRASSLSIRQGKRISASSTVPRCTEPSVFSVVGPVMPSWPQTAPALPS